MVMIVVNESIPTPTFEYDETKCSRHCHNNGCYHTRDKYSDEVISDTQRKMASLYRANIEWLGKNPLGLSYAAMNILLYVILAPLIMSFLLWKLIKPLKE